MIDLHEDVDANMETTSIFIRLGLFVEEDGLEASFAFGSGIFIGPNVNPDWDEGTVSGARDV